MMPGTHTALVKVYHGGEVKPAGSAVDYEGPLNWKFRPSDPHARERWEAEVTDPQRVEDNLREAGEWPPMMAPPLRSEQEA